MSRFWREMVLVGETRSLISDMENRLLLAASMLIRGFGAAIFLSLGEFELMIETDVAD